MKILISQRKTAIYPGFLGRFLKPKIAQNICIQFPASFVNQSRQIVTNIDLELFVF